MMKGKRVKKPMCKRLLLAVILAAVLVMPVFANVTTESKCDVSTLGVAEGDVTLDANWAPRIYDCDPGYYLESLVGECTICPQGSYCEGIQDVEYDGNSYGASDCDPGWTSDQGTVSEMGCYQTNVVSCADQNPYTYGHGSAVYANTNTTCKTYYNITGCTVEDAQACEILSLNCDEGYEQDTVNGVLQCVYSGIVCPVGTYLPQNAGGCSACPGDAYCPGGEGNEPGRAIACAPGLKAPRGARSENDCGYVLHIGNDILHTHKDKRTEHSLVIKVDGVKYYADATPVSEGVKTINPESTETLHINIDGVEYYVHETIYENEIMYE